MRPALAALAAAALLAGCSSGTDSAPLRATASAGPAQHAVKKRLRDVLVTVVDGDTGVRIAGARVRIGDHAGTSGATGLAAVPIRRRAALPVTVSKRGYRTRTVRLWFKQHPRSTVRIYQPRLQWPMYGAVPGRTQSRPAIRVRPPFRQIWSRGFDGLLEFPAVVFEGVAYVGNQHGEVFAVAMENGALVWKHPQRRGKMASSPAVWDDRVVVHGMDGYVRVLDRRNGRLLWSKRIGSPIESSPVVGGGVDYFGDRGGRVYALDLRTRAFRWVRSFGAKITSSAALSGGRVYIGDYAGRILALAQRDGSTAWARSVNGRVYGTPAVVGGRVFVPSSTGHSLTAFTTSGRTLWRRTTGGYVYSSPAVSLGRVYVGSYDGRLYALSARDGRTLWSLSAGGPISGAVTVAGGVVYAGSTRGSIVAAHARNGRVLLRFPHGEYVAASGNGGTLLLHGFSRLYAMKAAAR